MNLKNAIVLITVISMITGCKKDAGEITTPTIPTPVVKVKDTIYLLNKMVTNYLLTPSPVTQTETFTYNPARQLIKHVYDYKSYTSNFTTTFTIAYNDGKVSEISSSATKPYPWNKIRYSYFGRDIHVVYNYPAASKDSIVITLNNKDLAEKVQGNGQYYILKYDADGNIENRSQYENKNPAKPTFNNDYTYDKKPSPFWALRNNIYITYQAFNDINTFVNNRTSNNKLELYNYTYNESGYPKQMVTVHSSVAVKKVDYTYTRIIVDK
ncbi:hypothetical protein [Mucilaginibacter celer]|uniref:DUF4595 domain-containing protein n=1 Tax=Mucilaginibacter celer TaxID=2305508 RepID=A0A494VQT0_9SPHI|nr:hypothetical protein [Mucilaginibacter celer]AYL96769.1 hypothetical protein HYN43_016320 [Mucilaginibacter celer]